MAFGILASTFGPAFAARPFYKPDPNTLHLYHFTSDPPFQDHPWPEYGYGRTLTDVVGTARASSIISVGYSNYLNNAFDVGAGTADDGRATHPADHGQSEYQGADGAFTYEACITTSTLAGIQIVLSRDGPVERGWALYISSGTLRLFYGTSSVGVTIPTSGDHAWVAGEWYHVAAAYDGNEGQAGNLKLYWTRLQDAPRPANEIGSLTLASDLPDNSAPFFVGSDAHVHYQYELQGKVDEVRISDVARAPGDFLTADAPATCSLTAVDKGYELTDILGIERQYIHTTNFSIEEWTGLGVPTTVICESIPDGAGPGPFEGSVFISNGRAFDEGLGDFDWGGPYHDYVYFRINFEPPAWARSLRFTTQLITREYEEGRPGNDSARFAFGNYSDPWSSASLEDALNITSGAHNSPITHALEVPESLPLGIFHLSFRLVDIPYYEPGIYDTAILISRMYFSEEPLPDDAECSSDGFFCCVSNPAPHDIGEWMGSYTYDKDLISVPGRSPELPFRFSVSYNSERTSTGALGYKWSHSYQLYAQKLHTEDILVRHGTGAATYFEPDGNGGYQPRYPGVHSVLVENPDGTVTFTTKGHLVYEFDHPVANGAVHLLSSVTDAHGNAVTLLYDVGDRLQTIYDSRPYTTCELFYDEEDRVSQVVYADETSADNVTLDFTYDPVSGCLESWASEGTTISFSYDENGNLLTGTGPDGLFVENMYFAGRVVSQGIGKGPLASFEYPDELETVRYVDRLGYTTEKKFDVYGRVIESIDEEGSASRFLYDDDNNVVLSQRPLEILGTQMSYDVRGNLIWREDDYGVADSLFYDAQDNLVGRYDPQSGSRWTYEYDGTKVVTEYDPWLSSTGGRYSKNYDYWSDGNLRSFTDRNGATTEYSYTASGDLQRIVLPPDGQGVRGELKYGYDGLGRRTWEEDPNGNRTEYEYDVDGRRTSMQQPDGSVTSYTYDTMGRVHTVSRVASTITYTYSATGELLTVTDAENHTTRYGYDAENRLVSTEDPLGRVTHFDYDGAGRVVSVTDPHGATVTAAYDAAGNRTSLSGPMGGGIGAATYAYDRLGRVVSATDPLGRTTTTSYDHRGLVTTIAGPRGAIHYGYDEAGRLTSIDLPEDDFHLVRDGEGNVLQTTSSTGAWTEVSQTIDALGRVTTRTDQQGNTIGYEYDPAGNLTTLRYSDGKEVTYAYDNMNRMEEVTDWDGRTTTYTYDLAGDLVGAQLPDGSQVTYTYDHAHRLRTIVDTAYGGGVIYSVDYTLDAAGNRTAATAQHPLDPSHDVALERFEYDAANQLTDRSGSTLYEYDEDGNMTEGLLGGAIRQMQYNSMNQLTAYDFDSFEYDVDGVRVAATRAGTFVRFVYDPTSNFLQLLEEQDAAGTILARYVYGMGLIAREDALADPADEYRVYHFDARGGTVALTDLQGSITDRYAYGPFGDLVGREGLTPNPFTYGGRDGVVDDGNGLYYMRNRYFAPELMRFIQRDARFAGVMQTTGSLNRYAYVQGNPVLLTDPNGDIAPLLILGGIFLINAGIEVAILGATNDWDYSKVEAWEWGLAGGSAILGTFTGAGGLIAKAGKVRHLARLGTKAGTLGKRGAMMIVSEADDLIKAGRYLWPRKEIWKYVAQSGAITGVISGVGYVWASREAIGDWTAGAVGDVGSWTEGAANDVSDWTSTAADDVWNWTSDAAEDTWDVIEDIGGTVGDIGGGILDDIGGWTGLW